MAQESMRSNPFYHSGPVTGDRFYNRKEERARLLGLLGTTPPTSVALHGPERIGKSSLLRQLCEKESQSLPDRHLVYLDMQRVFDVEAFVRRFLRELGAEGEGYAAFEETIYGIKKPVVLCLDEFGKPLANPAFGADFYDFLRSLTQTGRLALVISTLRSLRELEVPSGADVSRFVNVFRPFPLGTFPPEAARGLVEKRGFTGEEVEWVLQNVEKTNHPYHLQLLGVHLFEAKQAGRPREETLRAYHEALADVEAGQQPGQPHGIAPTRARQEAVADAEAAPSPQARRPRWVDGFIPITLLLASVSLIITVIGNVPLFYFVTVFFLVLAALGIIAGILLGARAEG